MNKVKAFWTVLGLILGIIGTVVTLYNYTGNTWAFLKKTISDNVTISCPRDIFINEHTLIGTYTPVKNRFVRLYVCPLVQKQKRCYWLLVPVAEADGAWSCTARFGNPFWHDMDGNPPLTYEVVTAVFNKRNTIAGSDSGFVEIASNRDFPEFLMNEGATAVARCEIVRKGEKSCTFIPELVNPLPPLNPRDEPEVSTAFSIRWKPNRTMWVELWHKGKAVEKYPPAYRNNNFQVQLATGVYEIKIKEDSYSRCDASVWVQVVDE